MKKFLALFLAVIMICSALTACSSKDSKSNEEDNATTAAVSENSNNLSINSQLTAKKLKSLEKKDKSFRLCDGGIVYEGNSGKYGIISLDGKNDTGEKYLYCEDEGDLFEVVSSKPEGKGAAECNCLGLVDGNGDTVLEEKYAAFSQLNNRYYRVCEVTEITDNKDEALVYASDSLFAKMVPDEEDTLYKGNWYILDLKTNSLVDGATGTKPYLPKAYGNYIECYKDNKDAFYVNGDGKKLPENAKLDDYGTYQVENESSGKSEVYDNEDNLLFTYDTESNSIYFTDFANNYFVCRNEKDGAYTYYVLDASGKTVSSNFNHFIQVYGELILSEQKLYNFKGEQVIEGEYSSVSVDDTFENYYILTSKNNSDLKTVIDKEGTVIAKESNLSFPLCIKKGDNNYYYLCYKDKDFTLKGNPCSDWMVNVEDENGRHSLVSCLSGDTVIEGDYDSLYATGNLANGIYVLAVGENTADIYLVEAQ